MTKARQPPVTLRVVSISMADGSDINSPQAQERIARALLSAAMQATDPKPQPQPKAG